MADREKIIKDWESILSRDPLDIPWDLIDDTVTLLKEREAVKTKTGHWIFESAYCEAWSHTCSECGKRMTTAYNTYANYCSNCGAKMER